MKTLKDFVKELAKKFGSTDTKTIEEIFTVGCSEGFDKGYNSGYDNGFNNGFDDGFNDGFDRGLTKGLENKIVDYISKGD